jgi:hypothetical protein
MNRDATMLLRCCTAQDSEGAEKYFLMKFSILNHRSLSRRDYWQPAVLPKLPTSDSRIHPPSPKPKMNHKYFPVKCIFNDIIIQIS